MTINERILNEVYMEIGSPIDLENDKTAWRKIALEAMRRLRLEIEDEQKPNIQYVKLTQYPLGIRDPKMCGYLKPQNLK